MGAPYSRSLFSSTGSCFVRGVKELAVIPGGARGETERERLEGPGKRPTPQLLDKYRLDEYKDVVQAVKQGNVRQLNDALQRYQVVFIMQGTFLVLEKLRNIVHRSLFQKVAGIHAAANSVKANQVPLRLFLDALTWCGCDMDLDEVECIVANLIFNRFIKVGTDKWFLFLSVSCVVCLPSLRERRRERCSCVYKEAPAFALAPVFLLSYGLAVSPPSNLTCLSQPLKKARHVSRHIHICLHVPTPSAISSCGTKRSSGFIPCFVE